MSEFSQKQTQFQKDLHSLSMRIINKDNPSQAIKENQDLINKATYKNIISLVDELVLKNIPMEELKSGINKVINVFYLSLNTKETPPIEANSFLSHLSLNNEKLDKLLKSTRPYIKQINKSLDDKNLRTELIDKLKEASQFCEHYTIKENILFPHIEREWKDYRCVKVMWSFHDDIKRNLDEVLRILNKEKIDLKRFNRLAGDIFFNMNAIIFRENKILFPHIIDTFSSEILHQMLKESIDFVWPYEKPQYKYTTESQSQSHSTTKEVDLGTGFLLPEQLRLIFNHLPVDMTYVDEFNKVKFFSSPVKRIFPRTNAIIGRDVKNCHPPESVHIVDEIIKSFRSGEKDTADFRIKFKNEYILIQYFAVRDKDGNYKGVLEVTQDITEINKFEGEKRLLDEKKKK